MEVTVVNSLKFEVGLELITWSCSLFDCDHRFVHINDS